MVLRSKQPRGVRALHGVTELLSAGAMEAWLQGMGMGDLAPLCCGREGVGDRYLDTILLHLVFDGMMVTGGPGGSSVLYLWPQALDRAVATHPLNAPTPAFVLGIGSLDTYLGWCGPCLPEGSVQWEQGG